MIVFACLGVNQSDHLVTTMCVNISHIHTMYSLSY